MADPSPLANGNMLLLGNPLGWLDGRVRYVLIASGTTTGGLQKARECLGSAFRVVWEGEGCQLYELGRFGEDAVVGLDTPSRDPADWRAPSVASAETVLRSCNQLALTVPRKGPGLLIVPETWYPGWFGYADGRPVAVGPFASLGRQVPLTGAERRVAMVYYPAGVAAGLFVSLVGLMGLMALATGNLMRRGRDR